MPPMRRPHFHSAFKAANNMETTGKSKTFIALPVYGIDPFHVQCLLALQADKRLNGEIHFEVGDSSPSRVRNNLVQRFLERDCDELLFIDSDIIFTPDQVFEICARKELVVGGFYMAKQDGGVKPIFNAFEPGQQPPMRDDGMLEVRYMGTGFLRIKRAVFDILIKRFGPELSFQRDESPIPTLNYAFFQEKVYRYPTGFSRFLTEDWYFCQLCQDAGISVWGDMRENMCLGHRGSVQFPLQSQRATLFGPAPTPAPPVASPLPVVPAGGARLAENNDGAAAPSAVVLRGTMPLAEAKA